MPKKDFLFSNLLENVSGELKLTPVYELKAVTKREYDNSFVPILVVYTNIVNNRIIANSFLNFKFFFFLVLFSVKIASFKRTNN